MSEFWEDAFTTMQLGFGLEPTTSALLASEAFARANVKTVLIPGIGYGRNARPFLERGMSVTGIEISKTAIGLARERLGLTLPIFHGSVTEMPFDDQRSDAIFCHGLIYLLDAQRRLDFLAACARQLQPGGELFFSVISKKAPMFGQGRKLGEDLYERLPNLPMYFYDEASVRREFGPYDVVELSEVDEPSGHGGSLPFIIVRCRPRPLTARR